MNHSTTFSFDSSIFEETHKNTDTKTMSTKKRVSNPSIAAMDALIIMMSFVVPVSECINDSRGI